MFDPLTFPHVAQLRWRHKSVGPTGGLLPPTGTGSAGENSAKSGDFEQTLHKFCLMDLYLCYLFYKYDLKYNQIIVTLDKGNKYTQNIVLLRRLRLNTWMVKVWMPLITGVLFLQQWLQNASADNQLCTVF